MGCTNTVRSHRTVLSVQHLSSLPDCRLHEGRAPSPTIALAQYQALKDAELISVGRSVDFVLCNNFSSPNNTEVLLSPIP